MQNLVPEIFMCDRLVYNIIKNVKRSKNGIFQAILACAFYRRIMEMWIRPRSFAWFEMVFWGFVCPNFSSTFCFCSRYLIFTSAAQLFRRSETISRGGLGPLKNWVGGPLVLQENNY